jgi:two-component system OmpR family sensor kinase
MIETAGAISDGDLERRVANDLADPNLNRLADSLNTMLDRIQSSFADKQAAENRLRQFVADASHELRTPLTSIRGYSELYLSGAATTSADLDKQMARINDEAARLGRLVDDLLTLARLDEQRPTQTDTVDLAELARSAVDDHLAAHPDENVELDAGANGAAVIVHGDRDALRQVITNLLANTHHHTPPGTPVHVTVAADPPTALMRVADEGPGIDPDTADHIFDRFYRADKSRSHDRANSGLGLSIVAAIVAAHHGTIDVDPRPGHGATFTIQVPTSTRIPGDHT